MSILDLQLHVDGLLKPYSWSFIAYTVNSLNTPFSCLILLKCFWLSFRWVCNSAKVALYHSLCIFMFVLIGFCSVLLTELVWYWSLINWVSGDVSFREFWYSYFGSLWNSGIAIHSNLTGKGVQDTVVIWA